ncbi:hypothetical protein [Streptomyces liangshanensis]|uniref:Uncharacterized protein n=1 Tax=Streptomyces liangshanensis TaxID=2717324 RepID=A0A6G9H3S9_9ACTN|nr:hypothetical protein [Streptomyces liangshanensis]QIQ05114.1 hypothetical protein HA039_25090 [Streptomyces liangshanensis]
MTAIPPSGAFAAISRHFSNARSHDAALLQVPEIAGDRNIWLTCAEAYAAVHGPNTTPARSSAVWRSAVRAAQEKGKYSDSSQMLLLWLALPHLTGAAHRISTRLRAHRADVESEMMVAFLERLASVDPESPLPANALITAARAAGWRFAREGLRERPVSYLENLVAHGDCLRSDTEPDSNSAPETTDITVDRPDSPDGLRTSLRFSVPTEMLKELGADHQHKAIRRRRKKSIKRPTRSVSLRRTRRR